MTGDDPFLILVLFGGSLYVGRLWYQDFCAARRGTPNPRGFPGAVPCPAVAVWVAVAAVLALLAAETWGEIALGVSGEQRNVTVLFLLSMVAAAWIEELIFRGYLVVATKGRAALVWSILGFSLLFALLHPFLWEWKKDEAALLGGTLEWRFGPKALFSFGMVYLHSLLFYAARFNPLNPSRSLLPCFAAHLANNLGVFAIKAAQGHVVGWW